MKFDKHNIECTADIKNLYISKHVYNLLFILKGPFINYLRIPQSFY